ncbi:MAG: stage V sporulation protein AE, partial [Bacillota bacterium]
MTKRKVVVITDGDRVAQKVVAKVAQNVGGRVISLSGGNPTPVSGREIAAAIKQTPHDPVLVMIDDCGCQGEG